MNQSRCRRPTGSPAQGRASCRRQPGNPRLRAPIRWAKVPARNSTGKCSLGTSVSFSSQCTLTEVGFTGLARFGRQVRARPCRRAPGLGGRREGRTELLQDLPSDLDADRLHEDPVTLPSVRPGACGERGEKLSGLEPSREQPLLKRCSQPPGRASAGLADTATPGEVHSPGRGRPPRPPRRSLPSGSGSLAGWAGAPRGAGGGGQLTCCSVVADQTAQDVLGLQKLP